MRDKKWVLEDRLDFSFFNSYTSVREKKGAVSGMEKKTVGKGTAFRAIKNNLYIMGFMWFYSVFLSIMENGNYPQ